MAEPTVSEKWDILDDHFQIVANINKTGAFYISADQINHGLKSNKKYAGVKFEARLMAHFDTSNSQPELFKNNGISILPVKRGLYVLGHFNPFVNVETKGHEYEKFVTKYVGTAPAWEESNDVALRFNEAMGIAYAEEVGILSDFVDEGRLASTVSGRMSQGKWSYKIKSGSKDIQLSVNKPQIEIDGGYESENSLILIEAKREPLTEFNLRQLYFPFRTWNELIKKPVRSIFMVTKENDFYLVEYAFENPEYFEANIVKRAHYVVRDNLVNKKELESLIRNIKPTISPIGESKFPQANSPSKTFSIIEFLDTAQAKTKYDIAAFIGFNERQGDYYGNSCCYFGFAQRWGGDRGPFIATNLRDKFVNANLHDKKVIFITAMLSRHVFHESIEYWCINSTIPDADYVKDLMRKLTPLNETTINRRVSTVINLIRWLEQNVG